MKLIPTMRAALMLLASITVVHSATITWTNTVGGMWSVSNNWSPNQVPTNADTAIITNAGTYTVVLDVNGDVNNLTLGAGGGVKGVQTFVVSNVFTVNSQIVVTAGGVLNANGSTAQLTAAMIVTNGGIFNLSAGFMNFYCSLNPLVVTTGGVVNAGGVPLYFSAGQGFYYGPTFYGSAAVDNGGIFNDTNGVNGTLTINHGGVLNIATTGLTGITGNAGTINLTNGTITVSGFINQTGGVINLQGDGSIFGTASFTNQGTITQTSGTNSISGLVFDNSAGTISNLSGNLTLGFFQTNLAGTYYAGAGTLVALSANNSAPQLAIGTPFVLGGTGQYQLTGGYLYAAVNVPANLQLSPQTVTLGPGFQGGASRI